MKRVNCAICGQHQNGHHHTRAQRLIAALARYPAIKPANRNAFYAGLAAGTIRGIALGAGLMAIAIGIYVKEIW